VRWLGGVIALALVCGCGDDGDAGPEGCEIPPLLDTTVELDPTGPNTQIHAFVRFDGEVVWLAYNLPDGEGSGGFDVFVARLGCDGSPLAPAATVTTTAGGNDIDPSLAISGETAAVVWSADNGAGTNNIDILYRTYNRDGSALMTSDSVLETTRMGAPVTGNAAFPAVAALDSTQFAIAGVRGLEATGTFQAFVQRVAFDGSLVGEAFDGYVEGGVTHSAPTITADPDGALFVAWVRSESTDDDKVVYGSVAPGGLGIAPAPPADVLTGQLGTSPSYGFTTGRAVIAFSDPGADRQIVLATADTFDGTGASVSFGSTGELDHTPTVATAPGGGAVAYYRNISGFRNRLIVQSFTVSEDTEVFALGTEVEIPMVEAAPYPPAITHIQDDIYFVAWSQGTSPDFRLYGRFVRAP
jgi:hypothetical protein